MPLFRDRRVVLPNERRILVLGNIFGLLSMAGGTSGHERISVGNYARITDV